MGAAEVTQEVMLAYYRRLYPFDSLFTWLNHRDSVSTKLFHHREFAFSLANDAYLRYNSFQNADELKKQVEHYNPTRFEIGPVYTYRPKDKKTIRPGALKPVSREFVVDIDMTDYDPIRTCCSDASICRRCWAFISAAVRVLDSSIRDQFGYEHLLWVYSGRRGIHLWISDKEAMELTDGQRKAMVDWLTVVRKSEQGKQVNVRMYSTGVKGAPGELPPSLAPSIDPLAETFTELVLEDQDCFGSHEGYEKLLTLIPNGTVVDTLREKWQEDPTRDSSGKWRDFQREIKAYDKGSVERRALKAAMEDIILEYTYPRLDAEVSKHRNHLLKAPFCIHPKTGRVCVPVDPSTIADFNPEDVPTVNELLKQLDENSDIAIDGPEYNRTSLKKYVAMMDNHAKGLFEESRRGKLEGDTTW